MGLFIGTITMDFQKLMQRGMKDAADYPLMIGMVSILALMILPLPPLILDLLLAINITISVLVMLTSLYVFKPLDFSVFPAMLLVTTLFRLGLNVASTRLILLGASISVSGLSLLFPFDMPLFAHSFQWLNDLGAPGWVGMDPLPVDLAPQEEMQFAQLWHSIVAFGLMAVIIGHIYIGTVGMEGAYDAMGSGEVDENWAHQHHSIWYDELKARGETPKGKSATPAE